MSRGNRPFIFKIVRDLLNLGVSISKIAELTGKKPDTVARWTIEGGRAYCSDLAIVTGMWLEHQPASREMTWHDLLSLAFLRFVRQHQKQKATDALEQFANATGISYSGVTKELANPARKVSDGRRARWRLNALDSLCEQGLVSPAEADRFYPELRRLKERAEARSAPPARGSTAASTPLVTERLTAIEQKLDGYIEQATRIEGKLNQLLAEWRS